MLDYAIRHQEQLNDKWLTATLDDKYKYYHHSSYFNFVTNLEKETWNEIQMVSVDKEGNVIGYLGASINRDSRNVTGLYAINFYDVNYTFSKDFHTFLTSLFEKHKFNKITFVSIADNPASEMYDKYVKKYGGRIVGIRTNHVRLLDGKLYDDKIYEIMREDYEMR